jgi:DNA-binding NarL/FixJ family response regulator
MAAGVGNRAEDPVLIAVCAADETTRTRIEAALAFAGYGVAFAASALDELIETTRQTRPALVVVAWAFEPFTPAAELSIPRVALGDTPLVVVATGFLGAAYRRLVQAEVEGVVGEAQIEHALVPTIDAVLANQLCVPAALRGVLARPVFSHREKQVLELLLEGLTNGEIAAELFLSESTVKSHLASSFRKLGVSSRAEAVRCVLAPDSGLGFPALSLGNQTPSPSLR